MKFSFKQKKGGRVTLRHESEVGEKAFRDWGILLIAAAALILCVACIDGYLLIRISHGDFFAAEPVSSVNPESVKRKSLLDTAQFFEARDRAYKELLAADAVEIDPSR